jgi:hypothetical protein
MYTCSEEFDKGSFSLLFGFAVGDNVGGATCVVDNVVDATFKRVCTKF